MCSSGNFMFTACYDFDLWHMIPKLISTSTNPNTYVTKIGWHFLHWFARSDVHNVFGSLPAVTVTFDLLIAKPSQHICERKYICDQNWVKFSSLIFEIWCSQGFPVIACCDLDLWPQNLISISTNRCISVTKIGWHSLHWFLTFEIWCSQGFGVHRPTHSFTHSLTHGRTDPNTVCLGRRFFNGGGGTKMLSLLCSIWKHL